jgi:alpha-ketoglutarate-dependent taurine dioxygenase
MINYKLDDNGWTIIIEDFDLRSATQEHINFIAKLISKHTCVVVKNQKLELEDELRLIHLFKDPEEFYEESDPDYIHYHVPGTDGKITRVTGALNEHGVEGIAGFEDEMVWHCNHPYRKDRRPIVWLYGVYGTKGSRTSWNNNVYSYQDMDDNKKEFCKGLHAYMKGGLDQNYSDQDDRTKGYVKEDYTPCIVHTNNARQTGLFFPFLQIEKFKGMTVEESQPIIDELAEYTTQEKYCYHHDWQDGDLVLSEQWLGIHKRWKFANIKNRLLHRAVFDFPEQDYTDGV